MRIVVSNPDTIGDFVLRQPLYEALAAAGHELFLVVRSNVMPLAALVAPGATAAELVSNPYSARFDPGASDVQDIVAAARQFAPDVFCIAPYQRTVFDEFMAGALQPCRTVGMSGKLYEGEIDAGQTLRSTLKLDRAAAVSADAQEVIKNQRLCGVLLGKDVVLPEPRIAASPHQNRIAEVTLQQLGLRPGGYWTGCVGHNSHTAVRNWAAEDWALALAHAVSRYGWRLALIGAEDERAATEDILQRMGQAGANCENLCGSCESLDLAAGLIHHSAGYIGRDTGPMHIAAAMGKPVIAIFGGGTWPRFVPAARSGAAFTIALPCSRCDWQCHLPESYCVKRVPSGAVLKAIDELETGQIQGFSVRQLTPDDPLLARVAREGAASARDLRRRAAAEQAALRLELETARRSAAAADQAMREYQAEAAANSAVADAAREQAAETTRETVESLKLTAQELQRKTDQYNTLLELMHEMAREVESLSSQLMASRRAQTEVEQKCASLRHALETSLALRLARSLHWALGPAMRLIQRPGPLATPSGDKE